MAQQRGSVLSFNNLKGFGFLTCEEFPELFCHFSSIRREEYPTLMRGETVEFDIVQGKDGPHAENVRVVAYSS